MADETNGVPLSDRELELLQLVATGATNQQIARKLVISVNTVKVHLRHIFEKLGVESRTEATMAAIREGWVLVDGPAEQAALSSDLLLEHVERISLPQRLFLILSAVIIFSLVILLPMSSQLFEAQSQNPFTERPIALPLLVSDEQAARWNTLSPMPTQRGRLAAAYHDGAIYAIGGDTDVGIVGTVEKYDFVARQWFTPADKPTAVGNVSAAVAAGRIWVPGGFLSGGRITSLVEAYDLDSGQWAKTPALPEPICAYALATFDDDLYLFGGANSQGHLSVAYRFDTDAGEWQTLSSMPTVRAFASAAELDGRIYVVGGYDGQRELDVCQVYDPVAERAGQSPWSECAPLTVGRGGLGLTTVGSTLYAVGGGWHNFLAFNEQYDPEAGRWEQFNSPVTGEWRNLAAVSDDKTVYVLGGWDGQYLGTVWSYQAIVTIFLPITP